MALVEEIDEGLRAKARKMRRNASDRDQEVEIQQVTCIRGGARKDWLVLPLMTVNGRQCAAFNPLKTWLHQLLNGGCGRLADPSSPHVGAITNFFNECKSSKSARAKKAASQSKAVSQATRRGVGMQRAVSQTHQGRRGGARR